MSENKPTSAYALQKMGPTQLHAYIEEQVTLFKRFGHSPTMAFTHELIRKDDGYFHLVKRDKSIEVIDWDLEGRGTRIAVHEKMKHEGFFGNAPKEEDKLFLMGHDVCTVEVGETQGSGDA